MAWPFPEEKTRYTIGHLDPILKDMVEELVALSLADPTQCMIGWLRKRRGVISQAGGMMVGMGGCVDVGEVGCRWSWVGRESRARACTRPLGARCCGPALGSALGASPMSHRYSRIIRYASEDKNLDRNRASHWCSSRLEVFAQRFAFETVRHAGLPAHLRLRSA